MTRRALFLAVLLLAACEQRIPARPAPPPPPVPKLGVFSPPPADYAPPGCAVAAFVDRTGMGLEAEATEQLEGLLRETARFRVLDRQEYRKRLAERQPDRLDDPLTPNKKGSVPGGEYLFVATLHRYAATVTRTEKAAPTEIQVVLEIELKFVEAATGEILVHQRANRSRQRHLKSWGLRVARVGGGSPPEAVLDDASRAKVLRADLDETLHSMLAAFDEKFTKSK